MTIYSGRLKTCFKYGLFPLVFFKSAEVPDFLFVYADSDSLNAELAEWYAYSEEPEFVWNANAFKNNLFKKYRNKNLLEIDYINNHGLNFVL